MHVKKYPTAGANAASLGGFTSFVMNDKPDVSIAKNNAGRHCQETQASTILVTAAKHDRGNSRGYLTLLSVREPTKRMRSAVR